jgi:sec-independent protein translocase protein TatA
MRGLGSGIKEFKDASKDDDDTDNKTPGDKKIPEDKK